MGMLLCLAFLFRRLYLVFKSLPLTEKK